MSDAQEFWVVSAAVNDAQGDLAEQLTALSPHPLVEMETPGQRQLWLEGYFDSEMEARLAQSALEKAFPELPLAFRHCPAEDWSTFWRHHFKPRNIGKRIRIVPEWMREELEEEAGRETVYIEPGLSFGTGDHFTTQFCLEILDRLAAEGKQQGPVFDAGCGSAILSVAAWKLGWRDFLAVDIDAVAVEQAAENLERNQVPAGEVRLQCMDLTQEWPQGKFPLLMANMYGSLLMDLAPRLVDSCRGDLVLSGIRAMEGEMVSDVFARLGCREKLCNADHEWCGLWLELPS